jgi:hypothetical protein
MNNARRNSPYDELGDKQLGRRTIGMAEEQRPLSAEYDGYLQLFLRFAERGVPLAVTLNVGGF